MNLLFRLSTERIATTMRARRGVHTFRLYLISKVYCEEYK
jgi:hypothetical protein